MRLFAKIVAWIFFILFVLLAGVLLGWMILGAVLLGGVPGAGAREAYVFLLIFLALAGGLAWVMARHLTSVRSLVWAVGVILGALLIIGTTGAVSSPDRALFLARTLVWADSDVWDYQKFPQRMVENASPVFNFRQNPSPGLFQTIEYTQDGELKQAPLEELLESTQTTSFIVIKDDAILYEGYFNGYGRDSIVTSFSMAKSFTSALVGIAIDEGYIGSVNDRMVDYLPEMRGRGLDGITIRDLLLMYTGVRFVHQDQKPGYEEFWPFHDEALSYYYPDLKSLVLELPPSGEPIGAAFNYNDYNTILLGVILDRTTDRQPSQYLQEKIWGPLGMEFPASWSLDSEKHGFEEMASGINGRAIDFAKFGRLFLNNGNWNGTQIISENWVRESTAPDPADVRPFLSDLYWEQAGGYYKYMWWGMPRFEGGYAFAAHGHLGQIIDISPQDQAIMVRFGITDGVDSWEEVFAQILEKIR